MIATNIRRLGLYLMLAFALVSGSVAWWQVGQAPVLANRADNPEVIAARRGLLRGTIYDARGEVLASSAVIDGISRRTYVDPSLTHTIGYASFRFGTTGIERAFDDVLTGRTDPNPLRDLLNDILDRSAEPRDLTLTIDHRLQAAAAAQLGADAGAVVALDPRTGAILALVSSPTFDATPISGDPEAAQGPMDALRNDPANPLLDRARHGRYVPGSVMKVVTAASALDDGVIEPSTTFADQPREEIEGMVVDGFRITEHDLGGIQPDLWPLSPAMQVSSNIYFAHVALELGGEPYLDGARRFGFCEPMQIGSAGRALSVSASFVTGELDGECTPFDDDIELATAGFGQGEILATPLQMATVAAAIANNGVMARPWVVRDVREHAAGGPPSETVLERYSSPGSVGVISPQSAAHVRAAMIDAVNGQLGRSFAGAADIRLYGIGGAMSAGKTGTAQLGGERAPHAWFIGFAPGEEGATPSIAIAVLVEGGGSGGGRAAPIGGAVMAEWLRMSADIAS